MKKHRARRVLSLLSPLLLAIALPTGFLAAPALAAGGPAPATASSAASGFPVTVTAGGSTVHITHRPARILCLSASATQMLYALGAGPQVVAVDKYSTWPKDAPRTKLTGDETSAEDYLRYRPDLVIVAYNEGTMSQQLQKLGIPDVVLAPPTGMSGVAAQLALLGKATGHVAGAARAAASFRSKVAANVSAAKGAGRGRTYYLELDNQPLYTATSKTFIGAEFSLFGMKNVADKAGHGNPYPELSAEYLLAQGPDWVFLADTVCCHVTPASFARRPGFSVLAAVKDKQVIGVNDSVASQWGPHTIESFTALLAADLKS